MAVADGNIQFSIALPLQAIEMLKGLEPLGLYGRNRADIARNLILDSLKQLVRDGVVAAPTAAPKQNDM